LPIFIGRDTIAASGESMIEIGAEAGYLEDFRARGEAIADA
jgi:hypothetical protein